MLRQGRGCVAALRQRSLALRRPLTVRAFATWDHKRDAPAMPRKATPSTLKPLAFEAAPVAATPLTPADLHSVEPVKLIQEEKMPFREIEDDGIAVDLTYSARRMGFPHYENEYVEKPGTDVREETRSDATVKAERVMAVFRRSLNERTTNFILRKLSIYTTNPKPNKYSVTRFFESLEELMRDEYPKEYDYLRAFLCAKDVEQSSLDASSLLHPDHPLYDDLCRVILVHCRRVCIMTHVRHSLKRPASSLPQLKRQLHTLLRAQGWEDMVSYCGISAKSTTEPTEEEPLDEWDLMSLESDLADFRGELEAAGQALQTLRDARLTPHEIEKVLSMMMAFVKNAKAHRNILQDVACEIQQAAPSQPREFTEAWVNAIVQYLSGDRVTLATLQDDPIYAIDYLQYSNRNDAFLRLLLDARMRTSHVYIQGLDEESLDRTLALKPVETRDRVLTCALNLASLFNDKAFHSFYSRFVRHKLTWRSNLDTSDGIFLQDVQGLFPKECQVFMVELMRQVIPDLTLEALTISRLRMVNTGRQVRTSMTFPTPVEATAWHPSTSVFYGNLADLTTEETLRKSLRHLGPIKKIFTFAEPRAGVAPRVDDVATDDNTVVDKPKPEKKGRSKKVKTVALEDDEDEDDGEMLLESTSAEDEPKARKSSTLSNVVASERLTPHECIVEFESPSSVERALHPALKIFGVMVPGEKQNRAIFSHAAEPRKVITLHSIPYCTRIADIETTLRAALGIDFTLGPNALPDILLINGTMELAFETYNDAAFVMEKLRLYLAALPDPKEVLPMERKSAKAKSTKEYTAKTRKERERREEEKEADLRRAAVPTVLLRYDDPTTTYRPFEVSWTKLPRRRRKYDP
ncbi:hypothetical protein SPRG_20190 [Saprolegnia parasitica CBS 223.65]|uniref:Uncharacterized protein n=1 Tax=Saprolegnia parasitica (strain CBS 223.65) TaxID=695850 RepID=A0A067CB78_SAPPC|nr:hypothetical protein SPRG_20190 [Saprolegnia parasitica CBS 223.65]KDO28029.1 hypothetical protein SPRG_20190 [Saprolegnia parasitica CBS 223.65]|eukprot:XP_012201182.1 hypothetical protein SPRG_20190 [Saprolegnia parasitica CBS 223.65]